ncbi:hypothetical protein [Streptomyces sp. NPDC101178]|uniref:hypothetical protein n=1 Tax=Streptomyces sp. NPDC101178 TaxID=3366124 RepID=UPI0037F5E576
MNEQGAPAVKVKTLRLSLTLGLASALLALPTTAHAQTAGSHDQHAQAVGIRDQHAQAAEDHARTLAALKALQANAGPGAGVHAGDGATSWTLSTGTGTVN